MPPRLHPITCTGLPPECSDTAVIASGSTSSTQCSMPRLRLRNDTSPYSRRYVAPAGLDEVLGQRAAAAQVVAEGGRRERRHHEDRVAVGADAGHRPVVVDLAQLTLVDQRARHRPQVGQPAVEHLVRHVAGGRDHLVRLRDEVHRQRRHQSVDCALRSASEAPRTRRAVAAGGVGADALGVGLLRRCLLGRRFLGRRLLGGSLLRERLLWRGFLGRPSSPTS